MRRERVARYWAKGMLRQGDTGCMSEPGWRDARLIAGFCGYCLMWCCAFATVLVCVILATVVIGTAYAAARQDGIFNQTATPP